MEKTVTCPGKNIKEIEKYDFVEIGNHSHTHDYLIDFDDAAIENDLKKSISIFEENLGKNSFFFLIPSGNIA